MPKQGRRWLIICLAVAAGMPLAATDAAGVVSGLPSVNLPVTLPNLQPPSSLPSAPALPRVPSAPNAPSIPRLRNPGGGSGGLTGTVGGVVDRSRSSGGGESGSSASSAGAGNDGGGDSRRGDRSSSSSSSGGKGTHTTAERQFRSTVRSLQGCLSVLSTFERRVVVLRAGLNGRSPRSRSSVARSVDSSQDRVRRAERNAVNKLRAAAVSGGCGAGGAATVGAAGSVPALVPAAALGTPPALKSHAALADERGDVLSDTASTTDSGIQGGQTVRVATGLGASDNAPNWLIVLLAALTLLVLGAAVLRRRSLVAGPGPATGSPSPLRVPIFPGPEPRAEDRPEPEPTPPSPEPRSSQAALDEVGQADAPAPHRLHNGAKRAGAAAVVGAASLIVSRLLRNRRR